MPTLILMRYKWDEQISEQNNANKLRLKQKEFEKDITILKFNSLLATTKREMKRVIDLLKLEKQRLHYSKWK
uniref:50S ribosomal protein L29 n=1 Tax=Acrobeloides nanus TaxID=290746 RepID=A0A914D7T0_9BILA